LALAADAARRESSAAGWSVHLFPELDAVVVITTANFRRRDAHALSDRLLVERLVPLFLSTSA
jgi:hypothetical protein